MDLLRIIRSIEELIYELTSWLIFYPRMIWASIHRPFQMMDYVAAEELQSVDEQFDDALSPPLMLFVTIVLAHVIEIGSVGVAHPQGGAIATIFASEEALLLFRALLFSLFPLLGAVAVVKASKTPITRASLRTPFFSLCILAAPFALLQSIGGVVFLSSLPGAGVIGPALMGVAATVYLVRQAIWMRRTTGIGAVRASGMSLISFAQALFYVAIVLAIVLRGSRL